MSAFFLEIVNMSISASWIVLAVLLLRLLLKKAPKWITVLLWGIVAVRLICPISIESAISLIPSAETINTDIMVEGDSMVENDSVVEHKPLIDTGVPIINDAVNPIIEETFSSEPEVESQGDIKVTPLKSIIPILSWVWVAGMVVMFAYTVISYLRVKRKIGTAVFLRDNIYQSESVNSPFVLGIIKPKIYLPFDMKEQDMEHVIAHENAHIRRKDHLWKPFGFLILTLHWFNPFIWIGYVLLCRDIELACDEKVVKEFDNQQKGDYAQALLNCSVNHRMIAACPLAFGELGVKDRVKSVINYKKPAFWIIIVAIIASIVVAVCFLTDPVSEENAGESGVVSGSEEESEATGAGEEVSESESESENESESESESESETLIKVEGETSNKTETSNKNETTSKVETGKTNESGSNKPQHNMEKEPDDNGEDCIASGLVDGGPLTWELSSDGVLKIEGNRHIQKGTGGYEWEQYRNIITRVVIGDGVTMIDYEAFCDLPNLKSVYIGNAVTVIRKRAFNNCGALEEITLPASVEIIEEHAFSTCKSLHTINIPKDSKLTQIDYGAFANTAIKEFVPPPSLQLIGEYAFSRCESLEEVVLDGNLYMKKNAFNECTGLKRMYIGKNVRHDTSIGRCYNLEILENYSNMHILPKNYPCIKTLILGSTKPFHGKMQGYSHLETLVFGGMDTIEYSMFKDCTSLSSVTIQEGVKTIRSGAFMNTAITKITLPASITTLENMTMSSTPSLKEIIFKGDAPSTVKSAFGGLEATAYYPAGNPTWTKEVFDSFGGDITWVAYEPD